MRPSSPPWKVWMMKPLPTKRLKKGRPDSKALEWNEFRKKLSEFLARRGFSYSVIAPVVTRIWNEAHTDEQSFRRRGFNMNPIVFDHSSIIVLVVGVAAGYFFHRYQAEYCAEESTGES